jgi:hypothetical protein
MIRKTEEEFFPIEAPLYKTCVFAGDRKYPYILLTLL